MNSDIDRAVDALRRKETIIYPTDTVWGIGCDATDVGAVSRVYALKKRDDSKALIVLVPDMESLLCYTTSGRAIIQSVLDMSAGRPTTLVLPSAGGLAPNLLAADGTVALRITGEEFSRNLCLAFGKPLVSTSANISGRPGAAVFADIEAELLDKAGYVCRSRRDETSAPQPSRIVKINSDGTTTIIRP